MVLAFAGIFTVVALMMPTQGAYAADTSTDARFKAIYTKEWAWRKEQYGLRDETNTREPLPDHLPKMDPVAEAARLAYWEKVQTEVAAIPRADLSPKVQVDYDVYRPQIAALIADERFRDYEMPVNSDSSFYGDLAETARGNFRTVQDYRNYVKWLADVPRYFQEEIGEMRAGLRRGFTPPKVTLAGRDEAVAAVADAKPDASVFFEPFKKNTLNIPDAEWNGLRADTLKTIQNSVIPAYRDLLEFMRKVYIPGARTTLAADALPDGKAYYRSKILEFTTLDMDPAEIHQIGLQQVAIIHQKMVDEMHKTGFKGDFPAFLKYLRADPKFYVNTPDELLRRAAWIAKVFDGKASTYFGLLPRSRFAIKPVPADIAPFYTAGRGGPGVYLLNTYDLKSRPLYNLTALTLHESAPGHAFQIPLANERKDLPDFRRETYISAYGEGWAVYCERLGLEMGMYDTPYDVFGMWGYQIWRAARLVVDTGIHSQDWTREQAIDYLRNNTALPEREIGTEVDRYISWPGQALSYYLGEMAILKAREKAEKALGAKFNLRAFHDTVLEMGSVPLPVLTARIDRFIAEGGKGPYPDLE
ncbi:MAG TPA: DUF885 family protein [Rhizomicrobium sp.]|jgi:uncharacterized protein (DUF885 family)|nr:DUF885 family protein [Rhizomicrobium sp.]